MDIHPPEITKSALSVDFECLHCVNFSSSQNGIRVVKRLRIFNNSEKSCIGLKIFLHSSPSFFKKKSWAVDIIKPNDSIIIEDLETPLDTKLLAGLNEAEIGSINISIYAEDNLLLEETCPIDMLAKEQWGGIRDMAQLLAAYVSPNDPLISSVLKDASELLENAGHNSAIDGYQSGDPSRVWMLAGAIWSALTAWGLSYAVPPASFEVAGQKIRDPTRIKSEGLATCLDSALLLAACYEAAGLNAVVLFSQGHAWTGVWLQPRDFGSITQPDVVAIRKAVDANEFAMVETTLLTKRPSVDFQVASTRAREHITEENEHQFEMAVDISRARAARVRPLARHSIADDTLREESESFAPAPLPKSLDIGLLPGDSIIEFEPASPADRITRWQRKLLDLSLRNRLLNFKDSKLTVPFICSDVALLEDYLADGKRFKLSALKDDDPLGNRDLLAKEEKAILKEVAKEIFSRGQLAVLLKGNEMNARLIELYRRAQSDMQEGGTNTLFFAAGFLRWKKAAEDSRSYRAPLILIPVKLTRSSARSDFVIEHHEDDVRFNSTLLQFLKRDFGLNIPELERELPRDDSGIDVPLVFETMRQRIRDVAGFEVVEEVALSTFSFSKFLMWKDLVERTDSLRESRVVRHLVDNPSDPFIPEGGPGLPVARDVDRRIPPKDLFTPLPADSSQLAAVLAAQEGQDYVLIGPPGTGKSQTIANIIAQCLAVGKTVLFVAEKSAALNVVHRRLWANGLGDAVLELHSSKADRKSVLTQLGRSWERGSQTSDNDWVQVTEDLRLTRNRLNAYVEALHRKGTQGFSVYQAIGRVVGKEESFALSFPDKDAHDVESYQRLKRLAQEAGRCFEVVKDRPSLALVNQPQWSFSWESQVLEQARKLRISSEALLKAAQELRVETGLCEDSQGAPGRLAVLCAFSSVAPEGPDVSWGVGKDPTKVRHDVERLAKQLSRYTAAKANLSAEYPLDNLRRMPLEQLDTDWRMAQTKIWPFSWFAQSKVRRLLQTYVTSGRGEPPKDVPNLIVLRDVKAEVEGSELKGCPVFDGVQSDAKSLQIWMQAFDELSRALSSLQSEVVKPQLWQEASTELACRTKGAIHGRIATFKEASAAWEQAKSAFSETAGTDLSDLTLLVTLEEIDKLLAQKALLLDWTRWCGARQAAEGAGLMALIVALNEGQLVTAAEDAFEAAYARWWLPLAMDAADELRQFAHWDHEDAIKRFRALDSRASEMAADQVLRRIQHGLPAKDSVARRSELGTLRHQMGLQRPSMPIRSLIAEMPTTFTKLAPCVLMSPLSVAQYLPAGQAAFDIVIFDEASQITTWDAIGAIARGRQAIIVGDPKQLPPTNFFGRSDDEDENLAEIERDLPSILDEVVAAGIPTMQLDWHYRSRDESLIAFSNWHYYDGRLVTFPGPETDSMALQLHRVEGIYGRGVGRTNEVEARAISAAVVDRLKEWLALPEDERLTLGVITFNAEQQKLILDLLDEARRRIPELEWFFEDQREEPVIVKNLENIQGDERDVMFFSITFGPDHAGKLSMAFGALNGDGGEKRLNVAVTRARRELHIFSSIDADQIDLTRTRSVGVKHLKAFLDFAARGAVALPAQDEGSLGPVENAFEAAVKSAIEAYGWELRSQIGVSGFRIDLGVVHPEHAGVYLAGIECDGATYHSSATARDRDKVRQAVLEGLGWTILRVWSTDWFRNANAVGQRIHEELTARLQLDRQERKAKKLAQHQQDPVTNIADEQYVPELSDPEIDATSAELRLEGEGIDVPQYVDDIELGGMPSERSELYAKAVETSSPPTTSAEHFFDNGYKAVLSELIAYIVGREGPIRLALLGRRVSAQHGWQRTGRRIMERVKECLDGVECHDEDGQMFVWPKGQYRLRVPFKQEHDRSLRDVSRAEIAALIDEHEQQLRDSADPALDIARLAGISRLAADTRAYLEKCIQWHSDNQ